MPINDTPCRHHWRIGEVAGPMSDGFCLKCGATRPFSNHPEVWGKDPGGDSLHYLFLGEQKQAGTAW